MPLSSISPGIGKAEAVQHLMREAGATVNIHDGCSSEAFLNQLLNTYGGVTNAALRRRPKGDVGSGLERVAFAASFRERPSPVYLNGRPSYFPPADAGETWGFPSPDVSSLVLRDGYLALIGEAPAIFGSDRAMVTEYGSGYSGLAYFYDQDVLSNMAASAYIDGPALVLIDDVWGLNYCHWLLDWLPRLQVTRRRREDLYVIISPIRSAFQIEMLVSSGVRPEHIIALDRWGVVQARELIVPSSLKEIFHPALKGAPWALDFVRDTFMPDEIASAGSRRLYISRADAPSRRLLNEAELLVALEPLGFEAVTLSGRSVAEQAELFACADRIIGLHGAGLTNVAFCRPGARILEMFTHGYGTCAFWILATNLGLPYATFMMDEPVGDAARALNDVSIDVPGFMTLARDFLAL